MSDAEWAVTEPTLPAPAWTLGKGGRLAEYCRRDIVDGIRYLVKEGTQWRAMPADFSHWRTIYGYASGNRTRPQAKAPRTTQDPCGNQKQCSADTHTSTRSPPEPSLLREEAGHRHGRVFEPNTRGQPTAPPPRQRARWPSSASATDRLPKLIGVSSILVTRFRMKTQSITDARAPR